MNHCFDALKTIGDKLNIDIAKYQKCPTKEETLKLFNYIISRITLTDVNTQDSVMDICRTVNYLLARLKSSVKVYYGEFLKPNQTTFMAISVLALHVRKMQADTELDAELNERQIEICKLNAVLQNNAQLKESINEIDDKLIQVPVELQSEHDMVVKDTRFLVEEQAKHKGKMATLKDIQNKVDLLNIQTNEADNKDDKLTALIETENEVLKQLMTYENKEWHLEKLNDEISKEEAKQCVEEVTTSLDSQVIDTLQKLHENLVQLCYVKTDSDNLSEENFNVQRKLSIIQKQIQAVAYTEEELRVDNSATGKLESLKKEKNNSQITLDKLETKFAKLHQDLSMIREECMKMEAMFKDNFIFLYRHNEQYCDSIENNRRNFGI